MKARKILASLLWLFVAASVVAMVVNDMGDHSAPWDETGSDRVVVYSFHADVRCADCNAMEVGVGKTLVRHFDEQLANGEIEWRVANYEDAKNEQLRKDYEVRASTIVLAGIRNDRRVKWKNLENQVWRLVLDEDQEALIEYIRTELEAFQRELH